jgi:fucose 4-O-acetylase-like acetyltransferase
MKNEQFDPTIADGSKNPIEFINLLKCFLIFCILWGYTNNGPIIDGSVIAPAQHASSVSSSDEILLPRKEIYNFINAFHMPLFFMINGFLFSSSIALSFKDFFRKRFAVLMVPYLTWSFIFAVSRLVMTFIDTSRTFDILSEIQELLNPTPLQFYFLRDSFVTEVLVFLMYKAFKKNTPALITVILLVLLFSFSGLIGKMIRFIMPIFVLGVLIRLFYTSFSKHLNKLLIVSGLVFIVCLYFFKFQYTIYYTSFPAFINIQQSLIEGKLVFNFTNIGVSGFRLLTAVFGSIFFFALFQRCWKENAVTSFLSRYGRITLGIYVLKTIILQEWLGKLIDFSSHGYVIGVIIGLLSAVFVFSVSVLIIRLIQRNQRLTFILFGSSLVEHRKAPLVENQTLTHGKQ